MTPSTANNIFVLLENFSQWENLDRENPSYSRINSNFMIFKSQVIGDANYKSIVETFAEIIEIIRVSKLDEHYLGENTEWVKSRVNELKKQVALFYGVNVDNHEYYELQKRFYRDATWYYLTLFTEKKGHMVVTETEKHTEICKKFDDLYSELFTDEDNDSFELFEMFNEAKGYLQLFRTYQSFITKARLMRNFEETLTEIREFLISELVGHNENETNTALTNH